jgi:hypothetical protein
MVIENPRMEAGARRYEALAAVGASGEDMLWDSAIESFD